MLILSRRRCSADERDGALGTARQRSPSAAAASERADGFAGAAVRALAWNRTLWASLSRLGMREASVPPGPEWEGPPAHTRLRPLLLQPAEGVRGVRGVRRGVNEQCALTSSGSSSSVLALGLQRQATTGCHRRRRAARQWRRPRRGMPRVGPGSACGTSGGGGCGSDASAGPILVCGQGGMRMRVRRCYHPACAGDAVMRQQTRGHAGGDPLQGIEPAQEEEPPIE